MPVISKFILINNEPFNYNEIELFHGRRKMNFDISLENLKIFFSLTEKASVKSGIFFGTLLGALREKTFIPHDQDIDIYVLSEDKELFLGLLPDFRKEGLELIRVHSDMISLMRKEEYMDIYFFRPKRNLFFQRTRIFGKAYEYVAKNLETPVRSNFMGIEVFMPSNPQQVIREIYGRNWRTPIDNAHSKPNTFYSRLSAAAKLAKNFPLYKPFESFTKKALKALGY